MNLQKDEGNYFGSVLRIQNIHKLEGCDNIVMATIGSYNVIVSISSNVGDLGIFFPVETQLSKDYCKNNNLFSNSEDNLDTKQKGYVHSSGRIRCVKFKGYTSEGIFLPIQSVSYITREFDTLKENDQFNSIEGKVLCKKYVPIIKEVRSGTGTGEKKRPKINDLLIPGQFNFHYSTSKLQDNIYKFQNEDDVIVISSKFHGTSAVFSNILTKRKLSIWKKVKKFFGSNVETEEYSKLYSSRTVVKSIEGKYNVPDGGYYNSDIWGKVFGEIQNKLFAGYTIYGEIVGYVGEKMVQKDYCYGCKPGEHKFLIYRITETSSNGDVTEYSWDEIKDFCREHNLETVPELYSGTIKDWMKLNSNPDETFLDSLKRVYLEKDCQYCNKKVPSEGICIRNESGNKIAYKLKSRAFLLKETAELDKGGEVIE